MRGRMGGMATIREILTLLRKRPAMFIPQPTPINVGLFMDGFLTACNAYGVKAASRDIEDVAERRGWGRSDILSAMREKGLSEPQIMEEVVSLYEQAITEAANRA